MNVTAHQEKKNEETKTGKRKAGEERRQATNFKEAVCCPSVVVQRVSTEKKWKGVPWVTGVFEKANSHFEPTQMKSGTARRLDEKGFYRKEIFGMPAIELGPYYSKLK